MTKSRRDALKLMGAASAATLLPMKLMAESHAAAESPEAAEGTEGPMTHEVRMYNKHPDDPKQRNVFVPDLLQINPGDSVKFVTVDKGHNSASDKNMMPEGAEEWKSKISADFEITLDVEGTYGHYCTPHRALGMVGLILVGDPMVNYEAAKEAKQRGKAKKVYADIFERADALLAG